MKATPSRINPVSTPRDQDYYYGVKNLKNFWEDLKLVRSGFYLPKRGIYDLRWVDRKAMCPEHSVHLAPSELTDERVYKAEDKALIEARASDWFNAPSSPLLIENRYDPVEMLNDLVIQTYWFQSKFGWLTPPEICLDHEVEGKGGQAIEEDNYIALDPGLGDDEKFFYLVHELCHLLVRKPYEIHGRLYRSTLLYLWLNIANEGTSLGIHMAREFSAAGLPYLPKKRKTYEL